MRLNFLICFSAIFLYSTIQCYNQPLLYLGFTNILEGGSPLPTSGFFYTQYLVNYYSTKLTDPCGNDYPGICKPEVSGWAILPQLSYETKEKVLFNARGGLLLTIPIAVSLFSGGTPCFNNPIENEQAKTFLSSSGPGFGDLLVGLYLQWDTLMRGEQPLLANNVGFLTSFPTGKNEKPCKFFNIGNGLIYFSPYWASTAYFTSKWSASWRLCYAWSTLRKSDQIKPGSVFYGNYSMEYAFTERFYLAVNGYFVQQLKDDLECGIKIPCSREQVVAVGPGGMYAFSEKMSLFAYLFIEVKAKNRPQGINGQVRFVMNF